MKLSRIVTVLLFCAIVALPLVFFNFTPDSISLIDNRKLAENPLTAEGDITDNVENYISDRIGFRDKMISLYTRLNDSVFGKMVHPNYSYGKDGYVFGGGLKHVTFSEYHVAFADMVADIQNYCESRDVPFLFVFNPAKPAVYPDKIADGINYDRAWVDPFFAELDRRGVHYLDNTQTLTALRESGVDGFNQKYDANHWNDLGAFYGSNAILQRMQERLPTVHVNDLSEFTVGTTHETSLQLSDFPIDEYVPTLTANASYLERTSEFSALALHPSYKGFAYYINPTLNEAGAPRALVFQGSYMNVYGYKYLINGFGQYIHVHDYQNVIDFPYYFNVFQPNCVVFEVAEYTFSDGYFRLDAMKDIDYNPVVSTVAHTVYTPSQGEWISTQSGALTTLTWQTAETPRYVWLKAGDTVFDMKAVEGGWQTTAESAQVKDQPLQILYSEDT